MRSYETLGENLGLDLFTAYALAGVERADTFHQSFLEGAADGHDFAHGLHLRAQALVGTGKLFELPLRNFDDYVIERGFETGWSLACNVIGNFIERVADRELRCDFGNRKPRRFRRKR